MIFVVWLLVGCLCVSATLIPGHDGTENPIVSCASESQISNNSRSSGPRFLFNFNDSCLFRLPGDIALNIVFFLVSGITRSLVCDKNRHMLSLKQILYAFLVLPERFGFDKFRLVQSFESLHCLVLMSKESCIPSHSVHISGYFYDKIFMLRNSAIEIALYAALNQNQRESVREKLSSYFGSHSTLTLSEQGIIVQTILQHRPSWLDDVAHLDSFLFVNDYQTISATKDSWHSFNSAKIIASLLCLWSETPSSVDQLKEFIVNSADFNSEYHGFLWNFECTFVKKASWVVVDPDVLKQIYQRNLGLIPLIVRDDSRIELVNKVNFARFYPISSKEDAENLCAIITDLLSGVAAGSLIGILWARLENLPAYSSIMAEAFERAKTGRNQRDVLCLEMLEYACEPSRFNRCIQTLHLKHLNLWFSGLFGAINCLPKSQMRTTFANTYVECAVKCIALNFEPQFALNPPSGLMFIATTLNFCQKNCTSSGYNRDLISWLLKYYPLYPKSSLWNKPEFGLLLPVLEQRLANGSVLDDLDKELLLSLSPLRIDFRNMLNKHPSLVPKDFISYLSLNLKKSRHLKTPWVAMGLLFKALNFTEESVCSALTSDWANLSQEDLANHDHQLIREYATALQTAEEAEIIGKGSKFELIAFDFWQFYYKLNATAFNRNISPCITALFHQP